MLRFFRFNDPYRLLFVLLTVILLGIKTEFEFPSLTLPELKGMLVGEMMDGKRLYSEVWDSTPPVTAYVQYVLNLAFDRDLLPRHILGWIIIFFQAAFFGVLLINNKAFNESNYLPAFLFSLLSFFSFDTVSLTRELIASSLLLLAMNNLLREVEFKRQRDETVHNLGFYLGLASLSVFSYIIFFFCAAILLIIFTRVELRRFALFVFGFALPHLLLNTWYYWVGNLDLLWANFYLANLEWSGFSFVSAKSLFLLTALPIAYFLFSLIMTRRDARLTKYQSQILQVMFLWFLFGLIEVYFSRQRTPQALMVCVPPVAYFISHYLLLIKRKWIAESMLWLLLIGMMVGNSLTVRNKIAPINLSNLFIPNQKNNNLADKKILILDDNIGLYANNKPAGYFLEWKLAQPLFDDPGIYQHVLAVAEAFEKDPPEVVIDPKDKLKEFLPYLPKIQKDYRKSGDQYIRVAAPVLRK